MNSDGGTSNDMIYIPRDVSEMNFQAFTASGRTFTAAEQAQAWDAYIAQDPYLRKHRGEYAERGAAIGPMSFSMDVSIAQDFIANVRRPAQRAAAQGRHPELQQPAEQQLGHRAVARLVAAADQPVGGRGGPLDLPAARREQRAAQQELRAQSRQRRRLAPAGEPAVHVQLKMTSGVILRIS